MTVRINLLCPTVRRSSRKIGRNEPCPCGRTKTRIVANPLHYIEGEFDGEPIELEVPVKFKHCHGDRDNMKKAAKIQNYLRQHFTDILNKPRPVSKLKALATKFKPWFLKKKNGRK